MIQEAKVRIGSKVYLYHLDGWFDEGHVKKIVGNEIFVDFLDWIQCWSVSELDPGFDSNTYEFCLIPRAVGRCVDDFGQYSLHEGLA